MDNNSILIVEDDPLILDFLKMGLSREGFEAHTAADGLSALDSFLRNKPQLVILDLLLPGLDGAEVCKSLRARTDVPILVLTARDSVTDKIKLFGLGADDYVVKPFSFEELLARIRALMRRQGQGPAKLTFLDVVLDPDTREVSRGGVIIELSAKEFDLLRLFMSNPRRVLSKDTILMKVWGDDYMEESNTVEVYVGHLRRKLGEPTIIQTLRGAGYCLRIQL